MKLKEIFDQIKIIQKQHNTSTVYCCGGMPRDRYMQKLNNVSDIDLCSGDKSIDIVSEELYNFLSGKYNVTRKVMPDGHSSIYVGNLKLDFSSNFNAPNIEAILTKKLGKPPVSIQKEIFSRDFTCNSLLLSLDLQSIFDLTKRGLSDIDNKIIRTCLSPEITLTTNKNRVARAIYLACKLDFELDQSIVAFVKAHPESIKISTEHALKEKLEEAFTRNPQKAAKLLSEMNLWKYVPISAIMQPYYLRSK